MEGDIIKLKGLQFKLLITPALQGLASAHASELPKVASEKVHHPIHYKPHTPHLQPSGLTPKQVSKAYGFDHLSAKGKDQVIAIIDAYDDPNIEADLAVFSKQFKLPACTTANGCFTKIYASGNQPNSDAGWSGEIALDVEWVHAMAPDAKIILVEADDDSTASLYQAVQVAINNGATIVSMSWGGPESSDETSNDSLFNNPNVTFVASSGDSGEGTIYPASSPYVLAVGGTTLNLDSSGNYQSETAWSGSGGGISSVESWPASQSNFPIQDTGGMRGVPDVAYNADPSTGFSVYNSVQGDDGSSGWAVVGGTSAGAPQWAALIAVANTALSTTLGGNVANLVYAAANPNTGKYSQDFNDIIEGSNGDCGDVCNAQQGYDFVTGLGSPKVANLINDLPNYNSPSISLLFHR